MILEVPLSPNTLWVCERGTASLEEQTQCLESVDQDAQGRPRCSLLSEELWETWVLSSLSPSPFRMLFSYSTCKPQPPLTRARHRVVRGLSGSNTSGGHWWLSLITLPWVPPCSLLRCSHVPGDSEALQEAPKQTLCFLHGFSSE